MAQAAAASAAQAHASGLVHVPIICNGNRGRFLLERQSCVCHCKLCAQRAERMHVFYHEMTPTEFERHSGARLAALPCPSHMLSCKITSFVLQADHTERVDLLFSLRKIHSL